MTDNTFEQVLLDRFDQIDNRLDRMENRLDRMDSRRDRMDDRITGIENRLGGLSEEVAQIRGKLDARAAFMTDVKSWIAIGVAIAAVIAPSHPDSRT